MVSKTVVPITNLMFTTVESLFRRIVEIDYFQSFAGLKETVGRVLKECLKQEKKSEEGSRNQ